MTGNQLSYWRNLEEKRANAASEALKQKQIYLDSAKLKYQQEIDAKKMAFDEWKTRYQQFPYVYEVSSFLNYGTEPVTLSGVNTYLNKVGPMIGKMWPSLTNAAKDFANSRSTVVGSSQWLLNSLGNGMSSLWDSIKKVGQSDWWKDFSVVLPR